MTISLSEMAELARALVQADADAKQAEEDLKAAKERARVLREETIPSAMQEMGLESVKLETGQTIKVAQEVYASIPVEKKDSAFNWLQEHGFGGLIKVEVSAKFGREANAQALGFFEELCDRGMDPKYDQSVHPQTLKAFLKEQLSSGANVPLDLFGARPVWTAKIK